MMLQHSRHLGLLLLLSSLTMGPLALSVGAQERPARSVRPRVVATVTRLEPRRLAIIQTSDGATYEVLAGTGWRVGDTVSCEHNDLTRVPWQTLDCQKVS